MQPYQQPQNQIGLIVFKNKYNTVSTQQDMMGSLTFPDGKEMEVTLWTNTDNENENYLAGNVKDKWIKPEGYVSKSKRPQQFQATAPVQNRVKIDF
jgi:uncharacterized protein YxeA